MIAAREPIVSSDDIWTTADKGYDMKNDMSWYAYHILQQRKLLIYTKMFSHFWLELNTYKIVVI
jgi:hypothetical protein